MQLFSEIPLASLIEFCRVLRHNLAAGLTLRRVFRQQAERGPYAVRPVAERISEQLEQGESLEAALKAERHKFPPIFIALTAVGEESGNLPEVLTELEEYFLLQQRLRRQFISQIAWPVFELVAAIFVIAGMIFVLAVLSQGPKPFDPLGLGYTGTAGAVKFLWHAFGMIGLLIALYFIVTRTLRQQALIDEVLLRLPVVGPCMQALALMRFCLALRLTMETGMPITSTVRLSMRATGNAAYVNHTDAAVTGLKAGDDLTVALSKAKLFPSDFLDIMANAEEGGRVPEVMRHQGEYYEEEARRRMTILSRTASWGLYVGISCIIIFIIFRIFMSIYGSGGVYDQMMPK
jgi:type IV pilus assembly protein PilC